MKNIKVIILSILFYPSLTTQVGEPVKNQVICNIAGRAWRSTYVFDINQLPERCDIFLVNFYSLDRDNGIDARIMESNKAIYRSLVNANKVVYTRLGFPIGDDWGPIVDPKNKYVFQTRIFDPIIKFLEEFKVSGLLLTVGNLYDLDIENFPQKMSDFVSALKGKVDKLIVGLLLAGSKYEGFTDNAKFDFTITNKVLDLYVVDMHLNTCGEEVATGTSVNPITSTDPNVLTIEQVTNSIKNSTMDKSKIYAMIQMLPMIPTKVLKEPYSYIFTTYSIFCSSDDKSNSSQWCTSSSKLAYDQGAFAKQNGFAGVSLEQLDTDDYESECGCVQYPITNLIIDGWTGTPLKECSKLDQK